MADVLGTTNVVYVIGVLSTVNSFGVVNVNDSRGLVGVAGTKDVNIVSYRMGIVNVNHMMAFMGRVEILGGLRVNNTMDRGSFIDTTLVVSVVDKIDSVIEAHLIVVGNVTESMGIVFVIETMVQMWCIDTINARRVAETRIHMSDFQT